MKDNSRKVWNYVKEHDGEDFTAKDIANAVGLDPRQVNGSITAFARVTEKKPNPYMVREEVEVEVADGTHEKVKLIRLTDAGRNFDPDVEEQSK